MDWKYILSLTPEDLKEEEKDELFDTVAWFECDKEEIDLRKCTALLKVSQEILKYKKEQVETLLHELEELAIRQGEDDARRLESDTDARSSKSRKSSSIEYENLEQKYMELKTKYKKVVKSSEKYKAELDKANNKIKTLEQENRRLESEIQSRPFEAGSESDISETIKEQQRELVDTIHNKNAQISDLLRDIEEVEKENFILRDKLSNVRDELSTATKEITAMTDILKIKESALEENEGSSKKVLVQYESLRNEFEELDGDKKKLEQEMKDFAAEIDMRVDEWKKILDQKDTEIQDLKSRLAHTSGDSSLSSLPKDDLDRSQINALQRVLSEREKQLMEVQTQLQVATKEMEESTEILKRLKSEREKDSKKITESKENAKDLQKQLKAVHGRCQNLQEEVAYAEKTVASKNQELREILSKMKENGQVDLAVKLEELQEMKADSRAKEKQIVNLVKTCNKLQDSCDVLEKENDVLREKLGIPEDEHVNLSGYSTKQKRQKKALETMKNQFSKTEEETLALKAEVHKLNGIISSLMNQILDLGHKPVYDNFKTETRAESDIGRQNKTLVDENEALRKGLHEVLNSINVKKTSSLNEIKSETLEQLLRALDVKHISGWYHPAMRLQAELHNMEGINTELREQLRGARIEIQRSIEEKSQATETIIDTMKEEEKLENIPDLPEDGNETEPDKIGTGKEDSLDSKVTIIEFIPVQELINEGKIAETLANMFKRIQDESKVIIEQKDILAYIETQHNVIQQHIIYLLSEFLSEKVKLEEKVKSSEETLKNFQDKYKILETKWKLLEGNETDQERLAKVEEIASKNILLDRKVTFLEKETNDLNAKLENLNGDLHKVEVTYMRNIGEISRTNKTLECNLRVLKNLNETSVDFVVFKELQKNLDNMTIKYRELASNIKKESEAKSAEIKMLEESQAILEKDKVELKTKLAEMVSKLALQSVENTDDKLEKLSQKLAECEVNEITERQRANHTNNLYELVKEQLNKSEERFQEYSKYNEDLLKKNLILQDQLKETEDNLCNYMDRSLYKQLQTANNDLLKQNEQLVSAKAKLEEDLKLAKESFNNQQMWTSCKEQELLHLKHQIVDLISVSDEKMLISQLNSDMLHCRQSENLYKTRYDDIAEELRLLKENFESCRVKYDQEKLEATERESQLNKKIVVLQNLLSKQKQQYLGCIPLCSEEIYVDNLKSINKEKHETFLTLHKTKILENEADILKEQLEVELQNLIKQRQIITEGDKEEFKNVLNWIQEKKVLQLSELRYRRQSEFKEVQLEHFKERIRIQDEQIAKLDEELLLWHKTFDTNVSPKENIAQEAQGETAKSPTPIKIIRSVESQTDELVLNEIDHTSDEVNQISSLKSELMKVREVVEEKQRAISQLKTKITELEMTISLFRKQIGDKQSQITFYERHILELQNKKEEVHSSGAGGDNINVGLKLVQNNEEVLALKTSVKTLQENLRAKEEEIIKYQTLLKAGRDNHSLAAARLQEELQNLQKAFSDEKQKCLSLEETFAKTRPNRAAIEQYMTQVHALEKHTAELHTKITSLEAQLQSSRQEAVRWRSLANDRLAAMEELRDSLEEQHKNELSIYKTDSEKLKELSNDEINHLKQIVARHQSECTGHLDADIERLIKEKDEKIQDLTIKLRQMKNETKRTPTAEKLDSDLSPKYEMEESNELLLKELELLKKRYEQLLNKERSARDEIRELKAQLLKKPSTARSDKAEKSIKDQLQKKVTSLENEIVSLKESLAEQISINETHRVQASEDFEKWKKMKHWQQSSEKLKNKLKERDTEFEKLQQTCSGYRMLIERLEREKHNLENRIKSLKSNTVFAANSKEIEVLKIENMKLLADLETLNSRLEMQHHHSGGLGAAMMQEKLEGQERKIAILELTAKGTVEVRAEMERLQDTISSLQKRNLCLEAENLDLKLYLEQSNKEVPRLEEQIQHLENYIDVLKNENAIKQLDNVAVLPTNTESKKASELERTVFILKRVVEKLQAENKRLLTGRRPLSDRSPSADKLRRDYVRLKEQHGESVQRIAQLEQELTAARNTTKGLSTKHNNDNVVTLSDELSTVKQQLEQKSYLLDKVKVLLHRAAIKEKALLQEISELKSQREAGISPIQEESEDSSDL